MSFIDYNFFPILFFLGWNILTTKQFRPPIYHTLNLKTLPALSIFSLNPINKNILKTHLKHQKTSNILEFVPEFQFLSEKQKLIGMPSTNVFKKAFMFKNRLFQSRTKIEKKNRFNGFTNRFKNPFFIETEIDQKKLNTLNAIQKQRSKIRLVLKLRNQKLYSLNRFQIALCFSKILQPISQDMNNFSSPSIFSQFFPGYTDVSYFGSNFGDHAFAKPKHETGNIYRYEQKKKNWYMKTQFFQQVSWNMKYKILDHFSNVESLCGTTNLPVKDTDDFVKKLFQTPVFFSEKSANAAGFEKAKTNGFLKGQKFWQNYFFKIYGGSWYYENLAFPNHNLHNRSNHQQSDFSTKFESDIGIYALAHKLSSIGFHNSSSDIDIYPFKYNDSYRYNFQNMNLSNQRLQYFLGLSSLNNHTRNSSLKLGTQQKNTNIDQDFSTTSRTNFSDFRKFLDFQNPIASKIYAPIFQPQGLNLLFFMTNGFLNVIPNSTMNFQSLSVFGSFPKIGKTSNFSESNQIQPIIYNSSHDLKNSKRINPFFKTMLMMNESLYSKPKKFKMFNNFYHKLPINGIHSNFYPWITQNASERWSASNDLCSFLLDSSFLGSFSKIESKSLQANVSLFGHPNIRQLNDSTGSRVPFWCPPKRNTNWTALKKNLIPVAQKQSLKNSYSPLYFTERPSCIKKPSIFFSSLRNLPYFFISETLSQNNVAFPQTNLSLFYQPVYDADKFLNFPQDNLFQNNALKENKKKKTVHLKDLQHKSFSIPYLDTLNTNASHFKIRFKGKYLKPLSTFIKKEVGYETSLFSWALKANQKIKPHWFEKTQKNFQNCNSVIMNKDTWKVLPPLFQPLTFRFIDLNLPRTWSSEFFTSMFKDKDTSLNNNRFDFKDTRLKKKLLEPYPTSSHLSSFFTKKKPKVKLHKKPNSLSQSIKLYMAQKNFFRFSVPFYFSDFFHFSSYFINGHQHKLDSDTNKFDIRMLKSKNQSHINPTLSNNHNYDDNHVEFYDGAFPLSDFAKVDEFVSPQTTFAVSKQKWNNKKKNLRLMFNETTKFQNSKIIVYSEKPLLKNRTAHGPPLKNQKESISLPSYLKNITNQNYQNLCPNNLNELYVVFWILFNKTLFIYLSLHYLRKFISFLGTEYIRNLFKIFVTMKFIDGNILSIIKTFQDFNFQLNQQNIIDIKVNKQLKNIKRN